MSQPDMFPVALPAAPSREAGLKRLSEFTPSMGRHYAARRNFDFGPDDRSNVSALSPHVRHRLVLEAELAEAAIVAHGVQGAEKFIQEVCWRTYWKGWLEQRPSVWAEYRAQVQSDFELLEKDGGLRARYDDAVAGRTGLACFDAWVSELIETGYLHNHARMWFASIWVYTLDLPWALGADFFLRHLMDGDAASNTLGWRWVCGLQTVGKTYLARASNINKFTGQRFEMDGWKLASEAPPLDPELVHPDPVFVEPADRPDPESCTVILLHDEDLHVESWGVNGTELCAVVGYSAADRRSPLPTGSAARRFTDIALADGLARAGAEFGIDTVRVDSPDAVLEAAHAFGAIQIITQRPPQGPMRDAFEALRTAGAAQGVAVHGLRRDWDRAFYPHATKGFFKLKQAIPGVLSDLGLL